MNVFVHMLYLSQFNILLLFSNTGSVTHQESVEVSLLDDVALECNFTGFLPFPSVVTWRDEDGSELFNTDGYNISTDLNGTGNSQRGGDSLENGVRSILSISLVMDSDLGGYVCEMDGTNIQGTIRLTTGSKNVFIIIDYCQTHFVE